MAKEIDKIIQSKTAPKSNNVLWDDGENLKINRNGNWESPVKSYDFTINRSDFLNQTPRAFELAKIFRNAYLGYDTEWEDHFFDVTKLPNIRICVDPNVVLVDEDTVGSPHLVIPTTIAPSGSVGPSSERRFIFCISGYNYYQGQHYELQFTVLIDLESFKILRTESNWYYKDA